jgi:hypothetical protein
LKTGTWQGEEKCGMIGTLAVNCAAILDSSKDNGKSAAEPASDEIAM